MNHKKLFTRREKQDRHKKLWIILCILLFLALATIAAYFIMLKVGEARLRNSLSYEDAILPDNPDGSLADVEYAYNEDVISFLLIGVDKASTNRDKAQTEQADALYLFALNTRENMVHVIAISRNTLMDIDVYDLNGRHITTAKAQVCTAYAYGRTRKESADLTVRAVSRFLYNIPISGYYAIYTDAVGSIVNAVGGVSVVLDEDMTSISSDWKKGNTVRITQDNAIKYLQFRKDSNEPRLSRQKSFLQSFLSKARQSTRKDLSLPIRIYKQIASKTVTNVDLSSATFFASQVVNADFQLCSLKGEVGFDGFYETFTADEEALYELLTDVFFKKTN